MAKKSTKEKKVKKVINDEAYAFLKTYINNASPYRLRIPRSEALAGIHQALYRHSHHGSLRFNAGMINPNEKFKVVIEAHADEISWFVNYISPEGLIYLSNAMAALITILPRASA